MHPPSSAGRGLLSPAARLLDGAEAGAGSGSGTGRLFRGLRACVALHTADGRPMRDLLDRVDLKGRYKGIAGRGHSLGVKDSPPQLLAGYKKIVQHPNVGLVSRDIRPAGISPPKTGSRTADSVP